MYITHLAETPAYETGFSEEQIREALWAAFQHYMRGKTVGVTYDDLSIIYYPEDVLVFFKHVGKLT